MVVKLVFSHGKFLFQFFNPFQIHD
jgi:hypothetical protein